MGNQIDWYFDFISPFAYFQYRVLQSIQQQRPTLKIQYRPVLFAGILKHNDHKGPAEIPSKRQLTYGFCHWYALENKIPFSMPAAHPFNPLPLLRLTIAENCSDEVVKRLFDHVWVESADNPDFSTIAALAGMDGFENAVEQVADPAVKNQLIKNTEEAIERGVFGVPTIGVGDQLFWGLDMTTMALEYLDNPALLDNEEYQRILNLPVAQARR